MTFVEALGLDSVDIIGNSMGGGVGINYAIRQPAKVRRLVTIGGIGTNIFTPGPSEGIRLLQEFTENPTRQRLVDWLHSMVYDPALVTDELIEERWALATDPPTLESARRMYGKAAFGQMMAAMRASDAPMPWAMMHKVQAPTLLDVGPRRPGEPAGHGVDPDAHHSQRRAARVPQLRALGDDRGEEGVRRHRAGLPAPTGLAAAIPVPLIGTARHDGIGRGPPSPSADRQGHIMAERVLDRVMAIADRLREQAADAERLGRLPDETVKDLKSVGAIRLLQPKQYNGFEVHPREFAETVMTVASLDPASGWICGVVGVHPYQLAYADSRVPEEIWGTDTDTWVASPYAPQGVAKPVDGGYIFNGRWQFSSGTDACDWIFLGAMVGDSDGKPLMPPQMLHMILPRKDYQIVEDSWNVVGLRGTGSKDVIVRDAFVPNYRTMNATEVMDGTAQREAGMTDTLYLMPWSTMFPLGITSAVIGIAEGALAAHLDYQRDRVGAAGTAIKDDPYVMYAIGEAAADINAARQELLANVDRIYDIVDAGDEVSFADRAAGRRTQVRSAWRAVMAVDQIFSRSGGNALRMDNPLQRYWRDAHAGLAHAIHVPGTTFHASALSSLGIEPEGPLRAMI